jgi:murein L,D-transpeptidase YcbB/YkuD
VDAAQLRDLDYPNFQNYRTEVEEFYEAFSDTLPWIQGRRSSPQAQALVNLFKQADEEGLNPVDYDGPRWDGRLRTIDSGRSSESELVRFDLAVTISTMRYISDLHRGRVNPREFHFDLDIENKKIDLSEFLRQKLVFAEEVTAVMRTVEPPFPAYRQTVNALKTYMKLATENESESLPLPPKSLKVGDSYGGLPRLERLLRLLGDMPRTGPVAPDLNYRAPLVAAVKHFQLRHGLEPNGILDTHTFKELNTPLSRRVLQIKLTLERWRWLPHEFDRPPIVVNIPGFRLYAVNEENRPAFSMKVVVGRSYKHRTPVFATRLKSVIFRPYWNVPLDIQRKELIPELRKNPSYLREHSYEVVTPHGEIVSDDVASEETEKQLYSGGMAIRQRPGPRNSLGLVKFDMPNVYDVYMHGTPATQLFTRSRRDFSHGCIRVEDPVALAAWVLRDEPGWDTDRILGAMNGDQTSHVRLTKPIPVLILYGTAVVTEEGEVNFFDDIYELDAELGQALANGYPYTGNK